MLQPAWGQRHSGPLVFRILCRTVLAPRYSRIPRFEISSRASVLRGIRTVEGRFSEVGSAFLTCYRCRMNSLSRFSGLFLSSRQSLESIYPPVRFQQGRINSSAGKRTQGLRITLIATPNEIT